jgi:hypothetical protein
MEKYKRLLIALGIGFATAAVFGTGGVRVPEEAQSRPVVDRTAEFRQIGHTSLKMTSAPRKTDGNDNLGLPILPR